MTFAQPLNCQMEDTQVGLVIAAQQGDRHAFGRLVQQYERSVYATIVRRLDNHAEAQEVCQEVLIQAMRKIGQLRDPRCFSGWLRSMATRMAINRAVRRPVRTAGLSETVEAACAQRRTPLLDVLAEEQKTQVRQGLHRLSAMDRDTLVAFYFDGRSLLEMSDQFRTPVGTIKRRLHVARKRLAQELAAMATA
jgi:RNA polymerase sigma-70 factor, ECF subfamily